MKLLLKYTAWIIIIHSFRRLLPIQSSIYVSFPLRIRSLIIQLLNVNTKEKQQRCILAIPMTPFNHLILRCCFITWIKLQAELKLCRSVYVNILILKKGTIAPQRKVQEPRSKPQRKCTTPHRTAPHRTTPYWIARHRTTRHKKTRHDTTRHGTAWHNRAQHSTARHGTARHGTARHGKERHGTLNSIPNHVTLLATIDRYQKRSTKAND